MSKTLNIDNVTKGALAVLCSQLPKDEEGLTVAQAAQMLGISASSLNLMRHNKKGPQFYREDGKILYTPSSIRVFISQTNVKNRIKK